MSEKVEAAFIFLAPNANPVVHRGVVNTPIIHLTVVGVSKYSDAVDVAKKLVETGVQAIELCAGFGNEGAAMVSKAVSDKACVGVVRFDHHPSLGNKSGDEIFNS